eukprot:scaffold105299_cov60-Phaeocystis_antarctica.AAC.2
MARYLPNRAALCGGQAARRRPAASHQSYFTILLGFTQPNVFLWKTEAFNQAVGLVFLHPLLRVPPAVPARNIRCVGAGPCAQLRTVQEGGLRHYKTPSLGPSLGP